MTTEKLEKQSVPTGTGKRSENVPHLTNIELELLKFELLKKIDLFSALPSERLRQIAAESRDQMLQKDDVLFEEGSEERKMFIILTGSILITKGTKRKKRVTVLGPGEYVGEMSLIDHQPRSASAVAAGDTLLTEISEDLFLKHLASDSRALLEMMKVSSLRIRRDLDAMAKDMQTLSNFTHDMRNCLVPLGIAEVLLTDVMNILKGTQQFHKERHGKDKVQKGFDTMLAVRNNLVVMIDQSLACVKKTKTEYVKAEADVLPLIDETVEEISCHKMLRGKSINVKVEGKPRKGIFNYLDIKRVLQNLLINAGYVTRKEGNIDIFIKNLNDSIQISVRDYGCGIPEDVKSILLKENYTSKPDGNGFGLMSCKEIIEEYHQGQINFESEVGKGTTFYFTIAQSSN